MRKRGLVLALLALVCASVLVVSFVLREREPRMTQRAAPSDESRSSAAFESAGSADDASIAAESARSAIERTEDASADPDEGWALLEVRTLDRRTRRAVANVPVAIRPLEEGGALIMRRGSEYTNERGRLAIEVSPGIALHLDARARERESGAGALDVLPLAERERRSVVIEVPSGDDLRLCVRVIDGVTGQPIADATVRVGGPSAKMRGFGEFEEDDGRPIAMTGKDGRLELEVPSWRTIQLRCEAEGYGAVMVKAARGHERAADALTVSLLRCATLRVRIAVAPDARNAPAWAVLALPERRSADNDVSHDRERTAPFSDGGRVELREVPARVVLHGSWRGRDGKSVERAEPLVFEPGEVREVDWTPRAKTRIEGRVIDERGNAVPGRTVGITQFMDDPEFDALMPSWGDDGRVVADENGRFQREVEPGTWRIGPFDGEASPWSFNDTNGESVQLLALPEVVEIAPGTERVEVVIRLARARWISGKVVAWSGQPCADAFVTARSTTARRIKPGTVSSSDGSFVIGPVAGGEYEIWATSMRCGASVEPLLVQAGAENLLLQLGRTSIIQGVVVDENDVLIERCELLGWNARFDSRSRTEIADERFRFNDVRAGTYALLARTADNRFATAESVVVASGVTVDGLRLVARPAATLHVRYVGTEQDAQLTIFSKPSGMLVDRAGIIHTPIPIAVPAGTLELRVRTSGGKSSEKTVTVAPGEARDVVFD
jgi:hypothetical protein